MTTPIDEANLEALADEAEGIPPPQPAQEDTAVPKVAIKVIEEADISYGNTPLRKDQVYDVAVLDAMSLVTTYPQLFELVDEEGALEIAKAHKRKIREAEEESAKLAGEAKKANDTDRIAAARARSERAEALRKALEE